MKYAESLEPGFYLIDGISCCYLTGTLRGNKWINLEVANPQWQSLIWTCISPEDIALSTYSSYNPTKYPYLGNLVPNILNKKSFWQEVYNIYLTTNNLFICSDSQSFKRMWTYYREDIKKLGRQFLKKEKIDNFKVRVDGNTLFEDTTDSWDDYQKIRIQFLEYMIKNVNHDK